MWSMPMFKLLKSRVGSHLPTAQNDILRGVCDECTPSDTDHPSCWENYHDALKERGTAERLKQVHAANERAQFSAKALVILTPQFHLFE